jgi:hypothetical protein
VRGPTTRGVGCPARLDSAFVEQTDGDFDRGESYPSPEIEAQTNRTRLVEKDGVAWCQLYPGGADSLLSSREICGN